MRTQIKLGDRVRIRVNGWTGITTGRTEYINGCRQFLISPEELHDGKPVDGQWWDEQHLELIESAAHGYSDPFAESGAVATAGGPSGSTSRSVR
jgi:hypothetical protein